MAAAAIPAIAEGIAVGLPLAVKYGPSAVKYGRRLANTAFTARGRRRFADQVRHNWTKQGQRDIINKTPGRIDRFRGKVPELRQDANMALGAAGSLGYDTSKAQSKVDKYGGRLDDAASAAGDILSDRYNKIPESYDMQLPGVMKGGGQNALTYQNDLW